MIRALRYPRMTAAVSAMTVFCALWRDFCVEDGLTGWAQVLLYLTAMLLVLCLVLISCRFFVDDEGVGVGFLLRTRKVEWDDLAALGILRCNSRRTYLYGMYKGQTDFLKLLHRAPQCGLWGFVVPMNRRISRAVTAICPYDVDFSPIPQERPSGRMRVLWQQAALYLLAMCPAGMIAFATGTMLLVRASGQASALLAFGDTLATMVLYGAGFVLMHRALVAVQTCPRLNEEGVYAGHGLYLPWESVRMSYVKRHVQFSGLFMLSEHADTLARRGAPPVRCLSMPDTSMLLLAYLTYCPNASRQKYD